MAKGTALKVYWGNAHRQDVPNVFGKALQDRARVFFAWKKTGWETGGQVFTEHLMAFWAHDHVLYCGIAQRQSKRVRGSLEAKPWQIRIGTNQGKNGFRPEKELERTAAHFEQLGMPVEVAHGYVDACARMVDQEIAWDSGLEEIEVAWDDKDASGENGVFTGAISPN